MFCQCTCLPCRRQFHEECTGTCPGPDLGLGLPQDREPEHSGEVQGESGDLDNWRKLLRQDRPRASNRHLKDQQSTGRKRAAELYPLDREADCEWKNLKFAGGGKYPIMGCFTGTQQARHHGPDKNTLNNERGNVHRTCHTCHNRWHSKNDVDYVPGAVHKLHDPTTLATYEELLEAELSWSNVTVKKVAD